MQSVKTCTHHSPLTSPIYCRDCPFIILSAIIIQYQTPVYVYVCIVFIASTPAHMTGEKAKREATATKAYWVEKRTDFCTYYTHYTHGTHKHPRTTKEQLTYCTSSNSTENTRVDSGPVRQTQHNNSNKHNSSQISVPHVSKK